MIEDEEDVALIASLVGHTIVSAEVIENAKDNLSDGWCEHESYVLTLDDGRRIEFAGWGHDAWGATVSVQRPT